MSIIKSNITEQTPIAIANWGRQNIPDIVGGIENKLSPDYHYINLCVIKASIKEYMSIINDM